MAGSAPSLPSIFPSRPHTCRNFLVFRRTSGQSLSDQSRTCPRYLNTLTLSIHYTSYSPVRLKVSSKNLSAISTSLLLHHIWVLLSQRAVLWCLMIRPAVMCIPHRLQRVGSSAISCTISTFDQKWYYMK